MAWTQQRKEHCSCSAAAVRTAIKGLLFEGDGMLLLTKRLFAGNRFQWPRTPDEARELTTEQFRRLMDGFAIEGTIKEVFTKQPILENSIVQDE